MTTCPSYVTLLASLSPEFVFFRVWNVLHKVIRRPREKFESSKKLLIFAVVNHEFTNRGVLFFFCSKYFSIFI
jgi:hypothetical protein